MNVDTWSRAAAKEIEQLREDIRKTQAEIDRLLEENRKMRELLNRIQKDIYEIK